jgi:hypothetical protein
MRFEEILAIEKIDSRGYPLMQVFDCFHVQDCALRPTALSYACRVLFSLQT